MVSFLNKKYLRKTGEDENFYLPSETKTKIEAGTVFGAEHV